MNTFKKLAGILMVMLFASTYAAASQWMPEKYNLDDQLVKVSRISNTSLTGWEKVDNQSFVLRSSASTYYLIILSSPAWNLPFTERIGITGRSLMIRPGYDNVIVREAGNRRGKYIINKIYKFEDKKQVWEIIAQLTGEPTIERQKKDYSGETLLASTPVSFFSRF